jgi:hypothetical protein
MKYCLDYRRRFFLSLIINMILAGVLIVIIYRYVLGSRARELANRENEVVLTCGKYEELWGKFQKKYRDVNSQQAVASRDWYDTQSWNQSCIDATEGLKQVLIEQYSVRD